MMSDFLSRLREIVDESGKGLGLCNDLSGKLADEVAAKTKSNFGGESVYVCKSIDRNVIFQAWNGANMHEMVRRFNLSQSRIYEILREEHKRRQVDWVDTLPE